MKTAQKLQQINTALQAEILQKNELLEQKQELLNKKNEQLKHNAFLIEKLQAQLFELQKYRFGAKSEKHNKKPQDDAQMPLFNEAEQTIDAAPTAKGKGKSNKPKGGKRNPLPETLPRVEINHDLEASQKICPHDGATLKHIGTVCNEQLLFIPASVKVIKHICNKYACSQCNKYIITAKKPNDPIPKSIASPELLGFITTSKYADGIPLYRLSNMLKRLGINISRTNLANWMIKCGAMAQILINFLQDRLLEQPYIHMDESTVQVLKEPGKKANSKSYMWVRRAANIVLFDYSPNRSAKMAEELLADYKQAIMSDGYKGYDSIASKNKITHLGCWVHARRYFTKVLDLGEHTGARKMVDLIAKGYTIETEFKTVSADERKVIRQNQSKKILEQIKAHKDQQLLNCTPQSQYGKALGYLHKQWPKLIGYIEDGNYPIDNNPAEKIVWNDFSRKPSGKKASIRTIRVKRHQAICHRPKKLVILRHATRCQSLGQPLFTDRNAPKLTSSTQKNTSPKSTGNSPIARQ